MWRRGCGEVGLDPNIRPISPSLDSNPTPRTFWLIFSITMSILIVCCVVGGIFTCYMLGVCCFVAHQQRYQQAAPPAQVGYHSNPTVVVGVGVPVPPPAANYNSLPPGSPPHHYTLSLCMMAEFLCDARVGPSIGFTGSPVLLQAWHNAIPV